MDAVEQAARNLVQLSACYHAMAEADWQIQNGPGENKAFWMRVQMLIADRMLVRRKGIAECVPSGTFRDRKGATPSG